MSLRFDDCMHELDAARIISFWLALHGGDLAERVNAPHATALLAQSLQLALLTPACEDTDIESEGLDFVPKCADDEALSLRIQPMEASADQPDATILQYCVKLQGVTIWTELPDLTHERTAA
jgi:hypothetical protein